MKYLLSLLLLTVSFCTEAQSTTIQPEQAKDSIGKQATVCGTVTGTHTTDKITFINMGGTFPDNAFTVVVLADSAAKFSYKLPALEGKFICVTGMIKDYKGKPEIIANNEGQVTIKMDTGVPHQ